MAGISRTAIAAMIVCLGGSAGVPDWRPDRAALGAAVLRGAVALFLVLGAVVVPLVVELAWRSEARPGVNAQPEVAVIERAGDRVAAHRP